jgi:hypothetical protein
LRLRYAAVTCMETPLTLLVHLMSDSGGDANDSLVCSCATMGPCEKLPHSSMQRPSSLSDSATEAAVDDDIGTIA